MFGRTARLEHEVTATSTAFKAHVDECARRAEESARKLDKVEGKIDENAKERKAEISALRSEVENRHKENRKLLYGILLAVVTALGTRVFDYIHFGLPQH